MPICGKTTTLTYITVYKLTKIIMECIVLVSLLECNNARSCELHPFGCGNSLVLNKEDWGVGLHLHLCMMKVANELICYFVGSNGSDGCRIGFVAREYAAGDNGPWLDGAIVEIMTWYFKK